ncbi:hypothetical protein HO173_003556 [Letharia columbiana]|uniref:Uncharacterized protein n=1 Tax=Letharia columbiana TaxID=112416 RepID=A0A8H6G0H7_9LECA|nr:uncharacterized protein HO173_003556 [Letharia columbiana]KAF6238276.1 hypothetical protein HO173_003556 [Letharia columbiana]
MADSRPLGGFATSRGVDGEGKVSTKHSERAVSTAVTANPDFSGYRTRASSSSNSTVRGSSRPGAVKGRREIEMDQKPKFECGIILECIARRRRPLDGSRSRMVSGYRRDRRRFRKVDRFGMATLGGLVAQRKRAGLITRRTSSDPRNEPGSRPDKTWGPRQENDTRAAIGDSVRQTDRGIRWGDSDSDERKVVLTRPAALRSSDRGLQGYARGVEPVVWMDGISQNTVHTSGPADKSKVFWTGPGSAARSGSVIACSAQGFRAGLSVSVVGGEGVVRFDADVSTSAARGLVRCSPWDG